MKVRLLVALVALGSVLLMTTASATTFYIDQFQITKDGDAAWFDDGFDDGNPPPSSESVFPGGGTAHYFTKPNPLPGPEENSRVTLDTAQGVLTPSEVNDNSLLFQRARLATNVDSSDTVRGLKSNHTFSVTGVFDLIKPDFELEFYGIRLSDFMLGNEDTWDDNVDLRVVLTDTGDWGVRFSQADYDNNVFDVIDFNLLDDSLIDGSLPTSYEQIALTLTKSANDDALITASYELIDFEDINNPLTVSMTGSGEIFHGENWTRADFFAGRVIPEPTTLALLGLGLAGIGFRRKKAA